MSLRNVDPPFWYLFLDQGTYSLGLSGPFGPYVIVVFPFDEYKRETWAVRIRI